MVPSNGQSDSIVRARTSAAAIPPSYQCFPSGLPPVGGGASPQLAYIANCAVSTAKQAKNLQSMAVAIVQDLGNGRYKSYCTGTPLTYDATTGIGFVVTAAHCVVGNAKAANTSVKLRNITTFDSGLYYVYQGTPGFFSGGDKITGVVNAVYIPSRYCRVPRFDANGCSDLPKQNGDVAVLKVVTRIGKSIETMPLVRLAPANLKMPEGAFIMALGYGLNTTSKPEDRTLYYVDYQYFANDTYRGDSGQDTIMNGYRKNGGWYSIICQGDSGGGDFYWDGTYWNLVGAHSYGPTPCGTSGKFYSKANDVSADLRPWRYWIDAIPYDDTKQTGCVQIDSSYTCRARN
jgi:hypothetical protein